MNVKERLFELEETNRTFGPLHVHGGRLWARVKLRKLTECAHCADALGAGHEAFKALQGVGRKGDRYCYRCSFWFHKVEALLHLFRDHALPEATRDRALRQIHEYLDLLGKVRA